MAKTRDELQGRLDRLAADMPDLINDYPDPGDFNSAFAGRADDMRFIPCHRGGLARGTQPNARPRAGPCLRSEHCASPLIATAAAQLNVPARRWPGHLIDSG